MPRYLVQRPGASPEGPLTTKQILRDLKSGRLTFDATVCREDDSRWTAIDELPAVAALAPRHRDSLLAAAILHAITAVAWLTVAGLIAVSSSGGRGILVVAVLVVTSILRVAAAWGVARRRVWAYRRAMRSSLVGAAVVVLLVLSGNGLVAVLISPLEAVAAGLTWRARKDFSPEL